MDPQLHHFPTCPTLHMLLGTPEGMHDEEEVGLRIAGGEGVREGVLVVDRKMDHWVLVVMSA